MPTEIDFDGLKDHLNRNSARYVPDWLPGGHMQGPEYCVSNLRGADGNPKGDSLKVNLGKGLWQDFATGDKGDLIDLYKAVHGASEGWATRLCEAIGYDGVSRPDKATAPILAPITVVIDRPPEYAPAPTCEHLKLGNPTNIWCYRDSGGFPLFYVSRYDTIEDGERKKTILPWSWAPAKESWVAKGWQAPRPLYGLQELAQRPTEPVLIVEGEKSCDAAREIAGSKYVVITWPNGAQAFNKADWEPVYGRKVVIWPDADEPGVAAAKGIAALLAPHCPSVHYVKPDRNGGWDAHDALMEGWSLDQFKNWANPLAVKFSLPSQMAAVSAPTVPEVRPTKPAPTEVKDVTDEPIITGSHYALYEQLGLACTKDGKAFTNADNIFRVLARHEPFKDFLWYDEFHCKFLTRWNSKTVREWRDVDDINLLRMMQSGLAMPNLSISQIREAVASFAYEHVKNEPRDWLESLEWDGTPRIQRFFVEAFGCEENAYHLAASQNWWLSLVARIMKPGCKLDSMIVLRSGQGEFKSQALEAIAETWYTETKESILSKDFFMNFQGKLLVCINELQSFANADVNALKNVITCQVDRFRPPYGRAPQDFPRQCVFVGTTNDFEFLRDPTGARRFWPIVTGSIDLAAIRHWRVQLFAEAMAMYGQMEWTGLRCTGKLTYWDMPMAETLEVQEAHRQHDEWENDVARYIPGVEEIDFQDLVDNLWGIPVSKIDKHLQIRVGKILRLFDFENKVTRDGEKIVRKWVRKPKWRRHGNP